jgi:hypothetical protein
MEDHMGLFERKRVELPPLISDEELFPSVNFDSVIDWLLGLSAEEYNQVMQVANIHRQANYDAGKVLGKAPEPTTFIDDPKDSLQTLEPVYLTDDEPKKPKAKKK